MAEGWWGSIVNSAKSKSAEVFEFVKKDFNELSSAVKTEATTIASNVKDSLQLDKEDSTANTVKRSLSSFFGQLSEALVPPSEDDNVYVPVIVQDGEPVQMTPLQLKLHELSLKDETYTAEIPTEQEVQFKQWSEVSEELLADVQRLTKWLVADPTLQQKYTILVPDQVLDNFIPHLLDAVLIDYNQCSVAAAREPEVLSAMATIVSQLQGHITSEVPKIFDAVFECTLEMINKNFEEYPEHRTNFFLLLQAVNSYCFPAFLNIPPAQFKLVLDSIIWAFKHTMRNVADTGLQILYQLLLNVDQHEQAAQSFYVTYFTDILQHILSVVTDTSHTAGLSMHAQILAYMFKLVESSPLGVPLGTPGAQNVSFVQEYVASILKAAFSHLTDSQIKITVQGMFNLDHDLAAFKEHLRDFLVQIREYTGEDDSDLFLEEREVELRQAQEEKRRVQFSVPGILNPHEIPEEMQD